MCRVVSKNAPGPFTFVALPESVWVLEIGGRVDLLHGPLGLKRAGEFGTRVLSGVME